MRLGFGAAFVRELAKSKPEKQLTCRDGSRPALNRKLVLSLVSVVVFIQAVRAQTMSEYKVKAAFLCNFVNFVEWPSQTFKTPNEPITICVLGEDPFGNALTEVIREIKLNGRGFVERHIAGKEEARACQILFISSSERNQLRGITKEVGGLSVLTVGDTRGFAQQGIIVNFVLQDNRVRFEFNTDAADRAHLKISSKLLSLAKIVKSD
jgi:hypothetical protein